MDQWFISLTSKDALGGWGLFLFSVLTCFLAAFLSGLIGLEREMRGQAAGLRTHIIIAVSSSLLMTISIFAIANLRDGYYSNLTYDAARIAAGVLSGIGFMGAGAIIKNGMNIRGLTTAATLFYSSAIGLACGSGFVLEAIGVTLIVLLILLGLIHIEKFLDRKSPTVIIVLNQSVPILREIRSQAEKLRLVVKNTITQTVVEDNQTYTEITISFAYHSDFSMISEFCEGFSSLPYVKSVNILKKTPEKSRRRRH